MKNNFNNHTVAVYAASFPFDITDDYVCDERMREINGCADVNVKQAKYYVWKLLEIALRRTLRIAPSETETYRDVNGKWHADGFEFSLSHSGDVVAVAVSDAPIGVDVELFNPDRFGENLQKRIMTESEYANIRALSAEERRRQANVLWCKKEALFKLDGGAKFIPNATETETRRCIVKTVSDNGKTYVLAAASDNIQDIEFYGINVDISDMDATLIRYLETILVQK